VGVYHPTLDGEEGRQNISIWWVKHSLGVGGGPGAFSLLGRRTCQPLPATHLRYRAFTTTCCTLHKHLAAATMAFAPPRTAPPHRAPCCYAPPLPHRYPAPLACCSPSAPSRILRRGLPTTTPHTAAPAQHPSHAHRIHALVCALPTHLPCPFVRWHAGTGYLFRLARRTRACRDTSNLLVAKLPFVPSVATHAVAGQQRRAGGFWLPCALFLFYSIAIPKTFMPTPAPPFAIAGCDDNYSVWIGSDAYLD